MRVACPACEAQYDVPDRLLGESGRRLRCARCDHEWMVRPPPAALPPEPAWPAAAPAAAAPAAPAPAPAAAPPPPASAPGAAAGRPGAPRGGRLVVLGQRLPAGLALWLAWAGSLAAVAAMLVALWLYRAPLAEAWPPLARLYGWVGA